MEQWIILSQNNPLNKDKQNGKQSKIRQSIKKNNEQLKNSSCDIEIVDISDNEFSQLLLNLKNRDIPEGWYKYEESKNKKKLIFYLTTLNINKENEKKEKSKKESKNINENNEKKQKYKSTDKDIEKKELIKKKNIDKEKKDKKKR